MKKYGIYLLGLWFLQISLQARPINFVVLGDSLTEGYGVEQAKAFPSILQKLLKKDGIDINIINAGVSGSTTASAPGRIRWLLKKRPDWVMIALGANDGLRGIKTEVSYKNLKKAIELLKSKKIKVILTGMMMPPNYGRGFTSEFQNLFPRLAKEFSIPLIPFLLKGVAGVKSLNLPDQIHPNPKGHEILAQNVYEVVRPLMEKK